MTYFMFLQNDMGHSQLVTSSTISLVLANQVEEIINGRDDQFRRKRKESSHHVTGAATLASRPSSVKRDSIVNNEKFNDSSLQSTRSDGIGRNKGNIKKVQDVNENLQESTKMIQNKKRLLELDEKDKQPDKRPKTVEQVKVKNNEDRLYEHHKINKIKKELVEMDVCKCDEAVKARAIKDFLENSKELDSNLIVKKVKAILDYLPEEDTKIKTELVSVKTEPIVSTLENEEQEYFEEEGMDKIKLESVSKDSEPIVPIMVDSDDDLSDISTGNLTYSARKSENYREPNLIKFGSSKADMLKADPDDNREDLKIIGFIVEKNRFLDVGGNELWKMMEKRTVLEGRSWQSMKERFRKVIFPNINQYNLDKNIIANFIKGNPKSLGEYFEEDDTIKIKKEPETEPIVPYTDYVTSEPEDADDPDDPSSTSTTKINSQVSRNIGSLSLQETFDAIRDAVYISLDFNP